MTVRYNLAQATEMICGTDSGLRDPQRWVRERLCRGPQRGGFPGRKIGRKWFMTAAQIDAALETCSNTQPQPEPEPAPAQPVSVLAGLSEASRRRLKAVRS